MKKKIIFAATTPFAVNAFLANHLLALAKHYRVTLCVNTKAYDLVPQLKENIEVVHVDFVRQVSILGDLRSLLQLLNLFFKRRPDVVHSITPKAGLLCMGAAFFTCVPHRYHTFTGQVWANKTGLGRRLLKCFDRLIVSFSSRVFADSKSQCRFLEEEGIVRKGAISVMGEGSIAGVDLNRFHPDASVSRQARANFGTVENAIIFLFVGRLARDKGVFDLLRAYVQVVTQNANVELWFVGPNEEGLQEELQRLAEQNRVLVRWIGATPHPESYMAAADVLVLPSYREGFGSVIIEAAACGIPTVAYRIDGVIDAVVDNVTGVLVEVGNVNALMQAMLNISRDHDYRKKLGRQALARVEKDFQSATVTRHWLDYYEHAI